MGAKCWVGSIGDGYDHSRTPGILINEFEIGLKGDLINANQEPMRERVANRKGGEARSRSIYSHVTPPIYACRHSVFVFLGGITFSYVVSNS